MPIEQQPGHGEPETDVFAKIMTEEPVAAPEPAPTTTSAPEPKPARPRKPLSRRIARRILGPTLLTRKD